MEIIRFTVRRLGIRRHRRGLHVHHRDHRRDRRQGRYFAVPRVQRGCGRLLRAGRRAATAPHNQGSVAAAAAHLPGAAEALADPDRQAGSRWPGSYASRTGPPACVSASGRTGT